MPAATEARVSATPPVLELLERLATRYGPLVIHQSGGCCDGSSPICLPADELPAGPHDVLLGVVGSTPVYVDRDQDERWRSPALRIGLVRRPGDGLLAGEHRGRAPARGLGRGSLAEAARSV